MLTFIFPCSLFSPSHSKSSSYIVKQKGLARVFSREPDNLAQIHSYRHSGLINDKSVGVQPNPQGKGVVVSTKRSKASPNQIAGRRTTQIVKKGGSRHAAGSVAKVTASQRPDLLKGEWTSARDGISMEEMGRGNGGAQFSCGWVRPRVRTALEPTLKVCAPYMKGWA